MNETPNGPFSKYDETAETPNGAFPNYVEEQTETRQQYIDRIFSEWLEWAEGAGSLTIFTATLEKVTP